MTIPWHPRPILGQRTPDQCRVAACFPEHRRVAVPAANGVGKTYLAADLVVSFLVDLPAAVAIITAPTNRQVIELLWPQVSRRLRESGLAADDWIVPLNPRWFGGDEDAADDFIAGRFSISDMPREIRAGGSDQRVAWAATKRAENEERSKAFFTSLGLDGGLL